MMLRGTYCPKVCLEMGRLLPESFQAERPRPLRAAPADWGSISGQTVSVLYIAGFGRSGSTLLDRLLGGAPDIHSGGELGGIWRQGLTDDRLCSCGVRFSRCAFWEAVGKNSFDSMSAGEIEAIVGYTRTAFSVQKIWRILSRRRMARLVSSAPANFLGDTERIYHAIRDVSGTRVVVDSSKVATYLVMLAHLPSVNVRVVHLVRDPRAVAHSWQRPPVADPDGRSSMPRVGAVKSALVWLILNAAVGRVARLLDLPYVRVRYEDLVEDPARIVGRLWSAVLGEEGPGFAGAGQLAGEDIDLGVVHGISGNPLRFRQGRVPIVEDVAWKADPRGRRAVVAAITLPLRWRYGYRGRS